MIFFPKWYNKLCMAWTCVVRPIVQRMEQNTDKIESKDGAGKAKAKSAVSKKRKATD